ncbi:MAG: threonine ammonia-lyase IlvA [Balneolaceae bacterium]|nr:threonine ammonia-lyase IlvA [Balneolaceae bacterium]
MSDSIESKLISIREIDEAAETLRGIATHTPLQENPLLSEEIGADIWLKREDLQVVRSYKIRGAYNKIQSLSEKELANGVVCASAGNHAQGVAFACYKKKIHGTIFMPITTPAQKVKQVKMFGKEFVEVVLEGDTFDDSFAKASAFCEDKGAAFIPPFNDPKIIAGQGTVGKEILQDIDTNIDYLLVPVGGGGLSAGVGSYFKVHSPETVIIGIEPAGAPAMKQSMELGEVITLPNIDKFVDGAAVQRVGDITFEICREVLDRVITVPEGMICGTILKMYNEQAIVVEPAGALALSALELLKDELKGKTVVSVVSGSNNDITRTAEIKERWLMYQGLKHFFIVDFPQRAGALMEFLSEVLGPDDDITYFEYSKKTNRELGPALIGLELQNKHDLEPLIDRMKAKKFSFEYVNDQPRLFRFLT